MSDFDDADLVARLQSLNTSLSKTPPHHTNVFNTPSFLASKAPARLNQIDIDETIKETGLTPGPIEAKPSSPETNLEEQAQQKLSQFKPDSRTDDTVLILKSFLDHLPRDKGRWVLVRYIAGSEDAGELRSIAEYLYTTLLAPFKACGAKGALVEPSPLSREGIRPDDEDVKRRCFERDGYRCMLTGLPDLEADKKFPGVFRKDDFVGTRASYIIPYALGHCSNLQQKERLSKINETRNIMTLWECFTTQFGKLHMALEPTADDHTYKIIVYPGMPGRYERDLPVPDENGDRFITFKQHSDCELPSRVLLETHASIARILHVSGKGNEIDRILSDGCEIRHLETDGGTDVRRILPVLLY